MGDWQGMGQQEKKFRTYAAVAVIIIFLPIVIQVVTKSPIVHFIYWPILFAGAAGIGFVYYKKWAKNMLNQGKQQAGPQTPKKKVEL
jgi:hypothetical protein